jgi:glycosyltransferase involved in cell wall biosynthesis
MKLSVIIPAFNEELYLPATLVALERAAAGLECELIVADNQSTDETRQIAERHGARVVTERVHNIARVRNAGAAAATGEVLVFIDADTIVPRTLLHEIADVMQQAPTLGGAVAVEYTAFRRPWMRWYLKGWEFWGRVFNMKQGAAQFCRIDAFRHIGGYRDSIHVGEDIEFYWRLSRHARRMGRVLHFIDEPRVITSSRRFDRMAVWRVLVLTHPLVIWLNWKRATFWKEWYDTPIR